MAKFVVAGLGVALVAAGLFVPSARAQSTAPTQSAACVESRSDRETFLATFYQQEMVRQAQITKAVALQVAQVARFQAAYGVAETELMRVQESGNPQEIEAANAALGDAGPELELAQESLFSAQDAAYEKDLVSSIISENLERDFSSQDEVDKAVAFPRETATDSTVELAGLLEALVYNCAPFVEQVPAAKPAPAPKSVPALPKSVPDLPIALLAKAVKAAGSYTG